MGRANELAIFPSSITDTKNPRESKSKLNKVSKKKRIFEAEFKEKAIKSLRPITSAGFVGLGIPARFN